VFENVLSQFIFSIQRQHFEKNAKSFSTKLLPGDRPEGMNRSGVDSRKFEDRVPTTTGKPASEDANSDAQNAEDASALAANVAAKRAQKRQALKDKTSKTNVLKRSGSAPGPKIGE